MPLQAYFILKAAVILNRFSLGIPHAGFYL